MSQNNTSSSASLGGLDADSSFRATSQAIRLAVAAPAISDIPLSFTAWAIDANWLDVRSEPMSDHVTIRKAAIRELAGVSESIAGVSLAEIAQILRNPAIPAAVGAMIQPVPTKAAEPGVPMYTVQDFRAKALSTISKVSPTNSSPLRASVNNLLVSFYLEAAMNAGYVLKGEKTSILRTSRSLMPSFRQLTNYLLVQLVSTLVGMRKFRISDSRKIGPNVLFDEVREECLILAGDVERLSAQLTAWNNLAALAVMGAIGSERVNATDEQIQAFSSIPVQEFQRNGTLMLAAMKHFATIPALKAALPVATTYATVAGTMAGLVNTLLSSPDLKAVSSTFFSNAMNWYSIETPSRAMIHLVGTMRYAVASKACVSVYLDKAAPRANLSAFTPVPSLTTLAESVQSMLAPITNLNMGAMLVTLRNAAYDVGKVKNFSLAAFGVNTPHVHGAPVVTISRLPQCINTTSEDFRALIAASTPGVTVCIRNGGLDTPFSLLYVFAPVREDIALVRGSYTNGRLYTEDSNLVLAYGTIPNGVYEIKGSSSIEIASPIVDTAMIDSFIVDGSDFSALDLVVNGDTKNQLNRQDDYTLDIPGGTSAKVSASLHYLLTNDLTSDLRLDKRFVYSHYNHLVADMTATGFAMLNQVHKTHSDALSETSRATIIANTLLDVVRHPLMAGLASSLRLRMLQSDTLTQENRIALYDYGLNKSSEVALRLSLLRTVMIRFGYLPYKTPAYDFLSDRAIIEQISMAL